MSQSITVHRYALDYESQSKLLQKARNLINACAQDGWSNPVPRLSPRVFDLGNNTYIYAAKPPILSAEELPLPGSTTMTPKEWGQDLDDETEMYRVEDLQEFGYHSSLSIPPLFSLSPVGGIVSSVDPSRGLEGSGADTNPHVSHVFEEPSIPGIVSASVTGEHETEDNDTQLGEPILGKSRVLPTRDSASADEEEASLPGLIHKKSGGEDQDKEDNAQCSGHQSPRLETTHNNASAFPSYDFTGDYYIPGLIHTKSDREVPNKDGSASRQSPSLSVDSSEVERTHASSTPSELPGVLVHSGRPGHRELDRTFSQSSADVVAPHLSVPPAPGDAAEGSDESISMSWIREDSEDPAIIVHNKTTVFQDEDIDEDSIYGDVDGRSSRFTSQAAYNASQYLHEPSSEMKDRDQESSTGASTPPQDVDATLQDLSHSLGPSTKTEMTEHEPVESSLYLADVQLHREHSPSQDAIVMLGSQTAVEIAAANCKSDCVMHESLISIIPRPHFFVVSQEIPAVFDDSPVPPEDAVLEVAAPDIAPFDRELHPILPHTQTTISEILRRPYARCAWVIPVRGTPPWDGCTPALMLSYLAGDTCTAIMWTPDSLRAFWNYLISLREAGICGPLGLTFHTARTANKPISKVLIPQTAAIPAQPSLLAVDHIKVHVDAAHASGLRNMLSSWAYVDPATKTCHDDASEWDYNEGEPIEIDSEDGGDIETQLELYDSSEEDAPDKEEPVTRQCLLEHAILVLVDERNRGILIC